MLANKLQRLCCVTENGNTKMATINQTELTVDTVTPALKLGEFQISADKRGKELSDAERIRRVVIPVNHWGDLKALNNNTPNQGLTDVLLNGLRTIAAARLRDHLSEQPMARTVSAADYTVTALLSWTNETASGRGSITFEREQVEQWYPSSKLAATMAAKGKQFVDFVGNRLATLAAKNHGLKLASDADKLITLLADDADSPLGSELIQRLAHISKTLTAKTTATTISLDDL